MFNINIKSKVLTAIDYDISMITSAAIVMHWYRGGRNLKDFYGGIPSLFPFGQVHTYCTGPYSPDVKVLLDTIGQLQQERWQVETFKPVLWLGKERQPVWKQFYK